MDFAPFVLYSSFRFVKKKHENLNKYCIGKSTPNLFEYNVCTYNTENKNMNNEHDIQTTKNLKYFFCVQYVLYCSL